MDNKEKLTLNESKFSLLLTFIKKESIDDIKATLLKWSYLLNYRDKNGRTAFHYCSENSSALCSDLLLEKCPELLSAQDNDGYTALHLSVINGNQIMTRYLISKSDTNYLNLCDNELHTAIHWATVCGELECLDLLLNSGANPSRADIHGAYPIHYSAQMCSPHSGICIGNDSKIGFAVLNRLIHCPNVDVNCTDNDGRSPLLWAASAEICVSKSNYSSGSGDAILVLTNAGAHVASKDKDGLTALHCASSRGHIDCVETLVTLCGANPNEMDANGCPPLFYAVTLGHADCTRLLIESGADVNLQDFKGRTAAHCGAAKGQFETIKILAQLGANLWVRNVRGDLPLHEAVKSGRKELVKWLIDQIPASVNATNSFGRSSLHIAAINNNVEMCKILIDTGADVNTVMKLKGHFITPLDAALQKGYRGVAKYLLLHGALPASKISHNISKSLIHRYPPEPQQISNISVYENSSPIDSLDDWKVRTESTDSTHNSKTQPIYIESSRTHLPKLPTLVTNNDQILDTTSSTPSSLMENGILPQVRNVREFDTPLNDKPSNLKQAIITNVYVTNTPLCHSKRVPPLKKVKKKRRSVQNIDDKVLKAYTPSMSSSSSIFNSEENKIKVVFETNDSNIKMNEKFISVSDKDIEENDFISKDNKFVNRSDINFEEFISKEINTKIDELRDGITDGKIDDQNIQNANNERIIDELQYQKSPLFEDNKDIQQNVQKIVSESDYHLMDEKQNDINIIENKFNEDIESREGKELTSQKITSENNINYSNENINTEETTLIQTNTIKSTEDSIPKNEIKDNKRDKNIVQRTASKTMARKEFDDKSKKFIINIEEKEKIKTSPKIRAKKEFSSKMNQIRDNALENDNIIDSHEERVKHWELNSTKDTNRSEQKINRSEDRIEIIDDKDMDHKRNTDSETYVKSDNESAKSIVCTQNEIINDNNMEVMQQNFESSLKSHENVTNLSPNNQKQSISINNNSKQSSAKNSGLQKQDLNIEGIDSECLKSDSEKSQSVYDLEHKFQLIEDINNNCIKSEIERSHTNQTLSISRDKIELKAPKDRRILSKQTKKINDNQSKDKANEVKSSKTLTSNVSKSSVKSEKTKSNKSLNSLDKKSDNKTSDKVLKDRERKVINLNKKNTSFKPKSKTSNISKLKLKDQTMNTQNHINIKSEEIQTPKDLTQSKTFLSTSDLTQSETQKDVESSHEMKSANSNQEVNTCDIEDKYQNLPLFSSNESIFDFSLLIDDMERTDDMYSSVIDKINTTTDTLSPLEHIQKHSSSPNREHINISEYCSTSPTFQKCESRCSHRLHFKTTPASLGKVEIGHISSKVDTRRDNKCAEVYAKHEKEKTRRIRRVRPSSDGYKSIDLNIITQTVEKSLRKYQLERKLFEELHDLKRFQIRSGRTNEILTVKRLVDKFQKVVKAPGMSDFQGPYTYKNYEFYLYDQLRKLSTSNQGKVALLTRSASHENIQIIRDSNVNIAFSNPEIMSQTNAQRIHTNDMQSKDEILINQIECNEYLSQTKINELQNECITVSKADVVDINKTEGLLSLSQIEEHERNIQKTFGNNCELNLNIFDYTNFDRTGLGSNVCDTDSKQILIANTGNCQLAEDKDPEKDKIIKEKLNYINKTENEILDHKCLTVENQEISAQLKEETLQHNHQIESSFHKSVKNSNLESIITTNDILNDESESSSNISSKPNPQKSNDSQISDAKSTIGSTKSQYFERYSSISRKSTTRLKSNKIVDSKNGKRNVINKDKHNIVKQKFKKECLKQVKDSQPLEKAINRPHFKRVRMKIPPKHEINILIDTIKKRWKDIKETEMRKLYILSAHNATDVTQLNLKYDFTLWFELNKSYKKTLTNFLSIGSDLEINENKSKYTIHRTLSDSALNNYKFDISCISIN